MKKIILSLFAMLTMLAGAQAQVIKVYKNSKLIKVFKDSDTDKYKAVLSKTATDIVPVTSITLNNTSVTITSGGTSTFSVASVTPTDATDKTVTWSLSDNTATGTTVDAQTGVVTAGSTEGTAILTATANDGNGVTAQAEVNVMSSSHEYVDLGLSVKWATTNIGASKPEDYGIYFAWGATEGCNKCASGSTCTIHTFNWANAPFNNGQSSYSSDYFTSTGRAEATGSSTGETLVSTYDAATANWGSDWKMPTSENFLELARGCYIEYTSNYNSKNVGGYIVYKVKDDGDKGLLHTSSAWRQISSSATSYSSSSVTATTGSYSLNDDHIFLPAAGCRDGQSLYVDGSYGYYWSSSLYTSYLDSARLLYFNSTNVYPYNNIYRYDGQSVRPVRASE